MPWFCNGGICVLGFYDSKGLCLASNKELETWEMSSSGSGRSADCELGSPAGRDVFSSFLEGLFVGNRYMDVYKIDIPAWLSLMPQPGSLECSFCCFHIFLSFCPLWVFTIPPKGPAASQRNIIDVLSLFLSGWGWCTSQTEALSFTSIFICTSSSLAHIH